MSPYILFFWYLFILMFPYTLFFWYVFILMSPYIVFFWFVFILMSPWQRRLFQGGLGPFIVHSCIMFLAGSLNQENFTPDFPHKYQEEGKPGD